MRNRPRATRSRARRLPPSKATAEAGPVETEKSVKPDPAKGPQPQRVVIFVGGVGDSLFRPVEGYVAEFRRDHPGIRTEYFSHDQPGAIRRLIESLPYGTPVSLSATVGAATPRRRPRCGSAPMAGA
jgi:hypothetical protein